LFAADFPARSRHVFSLSENFYFHSLYVDSRNDNRLFLGAVWVVTDAIVIPVIWLLENTCKLTVSATVRSLFAVFSTAFGGFAYVEI